MSGKLSVSRRVAFLAGAIVLLGGGILIGKYVFGAGSELARFTGPATIGGQAQSAAGDQHIATNQSLVEPDLQPRELEQGVPAELIEIGVGPLPNFIPFEVAESEVMTESSEDTDSTITNPEAQGLFAEGNIQDDVMQAELQAMSDAIEKPELSAATDDETLEAHSSADGDPLIEPEGLQAPGNYEVRDWIDRAEVDFWRIDLSAGERMESRMTRLTGDLDPYLIIYSPTSVIMNRPHEDDDRAGNRNALSTVIATSSGSHRIAARDYDGTHSGAYRLQISVTSGGSASCPRTESNGRRGSCQCVGYVLNRFNWCPLGGYPTAASMATTSYWNSRSWSARSWPAENGVIILQPSARVYSENGGRWISNIGWGAGHIGIVRAKQDYHDRNASWVLMDSANWGYGVTSSRADCSNVTSDWVWVPRSGVTYWAP